MPHRFSNNLANDRATSPALAQVSCAFAAILAIISVSPGFFNAAAIAPYTWRVAQVLIVISVWTYAGRLTINWSALRTFSPWFLALLVLSVTHLHEANTLTVFLRTLTMAATFAICASVPWDRDQSNPLKLFFIVLMYASLLASVIATFDLLGSGWTWQAGRQIKMRYMESGRLPLNISLFVVSVGVLAAPPKGRVLRWVTFGGFAFMSVLLATRTPLLSLLGTLVVTRLLFKFIGAQRRQATLLAVVLVLLPIAITLFVTANTDASFSRLMAGRPHLWRAGIEQWVSAPMSGSPSATTADALLSARSSMQFMYAWEFGALADLKSGGFHNIWIQTLATYGVIGFCGVLVSYFFLVRHGLYNRNFAYTAMILLLLGRSLVEYSALLAQSNTVLDLICCTAIGYLYSLANTKDASAVTTPPSVSLSRQRR